MSKIGANEPFGAYPRSPIGVIDIGSNSVRLVVYDNARRSPHVLFNEKVLCGLGRSLAASRRLDDAGVACAVEALARFSYLIGEMNLVHLDVVATSAVRDAENGAAFVDRVRDVCGLEMRVLTGEEEARYSAYGVLSGTPEADGIVGDLGGGSLELIRLAGGEVCERTTLPIGPVRLLGNARLSARQRTDLIARSLREIDWLKSGAGKPLYVVGGAWRALARADIARTNYPLRVVHHYELSRAAISQSRRWTRELLKREVRRKLRISERRTPTLPLAAHTLHQIVETIDASHAMVSALGLREGILYERLSPQLRSKDPFIDSCEEMAARLGRFPEHGDIVMRWLDPLFAPGEREEDRRLRRGICLTSDIEWRGHPDFRAEAAMYDSLYGALVGIDACGRAMLGLALFVCYGGLPEHKNAQVAVGLLSPEERQRAIAIGKVLRLAHRFSGGTAMPLENSRIQLDGGRLVLTVACNVAPLVGEVVRRRLASAAAALNVNEDVRIVARL